MTEKIFVNNSTPTIQEEVITLRIENAELKAQLDALTIKNTDLENYIKNNIIENSKIFLKSL